MRKVFKHPLSPVHAVVLVEPQGARLVLIINRKPHLALSVGFSWHAVVWNYLSGREFTDEEAKCTFGEK